MAEKQKKGGGGNRKHGRAVRKCAAYRAHKTMERNKIKRILQSNGFKAALAFARANGIPDPRGA
jgi:hypothetical protein